MTRHVALDGGPAGKPVAAGGAVLVGQLELAEPICDLTVPARDGLSYSATRLLVRLHGQPLGFMTVPLVDGWPDPVRVARLLWSRWPVWAPSGVHAASRHRPAVPATRR